MQADVCLSFYQFFFCNRGWWGHWGQHKCHSGSGNATVMLGIEPSQDGVFKTEEQEKYRGKKQQMFFGVNCVTKEQF